MAEKDKKLSNGKDDPKHVHKHSIHVGNAPIVMMAGNEVTDPARMRMRGHDHHRSYVYDPKDC